MQEWKGLFSSASSRDQCADRFEWQFAEWNCTKLILIWTECGGPISSCTPRWRPWPVTQCHQVTMAAAAPPLNWHSTMRKLNRIRFVLIDLSHVVDIYSVNQNRKLSYVLVKIVLEYKIIRLFSVRICYLPLNRHCRTFIFDHFKAKCRR